MLGPEPMDAELSCFEKPNRESFGQAAGVPKSKAGDEHVGVGTSGTLFNPLLSGVALCAHDSPGAGGAGPPGCGFDTRPLVSVNPQWRGWCLSPGHSRALAVGRPSRDGCLGAGRRDVRAEVPGNPMGIILGNASYSGAPGPLHMLIPLPGSHPHSVHVGNFHSAFGIWLQGHFFWKTSCGRGCTFLPLLP